MLILTRMKDQKIKIGNDIVITVAEIKGGKVRIGIDAPRDMAISRPEAGEKPTVIPFRPLTDSE